MKCKNLAGPWQEVEIRAHTLDELNQTEFWSFLEDAVKGFEFQTEKSEENIENHMPWKKLGRTWHYSSKGFSLGKHRKWDQELLSKLEGLINETGGEIDWVWDNKVLAHFKLAENEQMWGTINTKKEQILPLFLYNPKGAISLGEVTEFGTAAELVTKDDGKDYVRIDFDSPEQLDDDSFKSFLKKHFDLIQA